MGWGLVYTGVKGLLHTRDGMRASKGVASYKGWDGGWYIQGLRGYNIQGMGWGLVYTGFKGL